MKKETHKTSCEVPQLSLHIALLHKCSPDVVGFPLKSPTVLQCGWWCSSCAWPWWLWPSSFSNSSVLSATTAVCRPARVSDGWLLSVSPSGLSLAWIQWDSTESSLGIFGFVGSSICHLIGKEKHNIQNELMNILPWVLNCECIEEEIKPTVIWTASKYSWYWSRHLLFKSIVFSPVIFSAALVQYPAQFASFTAWLLCST